MEREGCRAYLYKEVKGGDLVDAACIIVIIGRGGGSLSMGWIPGEQGV